MKRFFTIFALMSFLAVPGAFAQEGSELEDLIIDDFGDDLFLPDESTLDDSLELPEAPPIGNEGFDDSELILDPFVDDLGGDEILTPVADNPIIEDNLVAEDEAHSSAMAPSGNLPASANATFSVVNVSQDNQDAETVGARPGDLLRYELRITSDVEDVNDYVASIDVANVIAALDFTDTGLGVLENGRITYPAYSNAAPCEQVFTFFAQVKPDCGDLRSLAVGAEGDSTTVGTSCELAQTGPGQRIFLVAGIMVLMMSLILGMSWRSKTS